MSNAIVVPDAFKGQVAAVFAGAAGAGDDLSGGITGGYGLIKYRGKVWTIQYHGNSLNLMRDDGDGPRGSIDIVIVKANAQLSKTWYENGWDENANAPPDCASANGISPDQGVPKPQSNLCATCPKNAWGSAPNGGKGKACGDHRRLAVVPLADLRNEGFGGPLLLRCPAASLQDMAAFDARYKGMGYPYFTMGIKIGFDAQESYPKFTFAAIRPLTEDEGRIIMELRSSPETARVVNEGSAPAQAQIAAPAQAAFLEAPPANAIQPQQVAVQPVAVAQPAPAQPQPVAQPVAAAPTVTEAVRPAPAAAAPQPAPAAVGGFGPVAAVTPSAPAATAAPAAAPVATGFGAAAPSAPAAAQPKPAVAMTGFGGATTAPVAAPAQAAPAAAPEAAPAPAPVAPAVVSAFEGSIDDRLNALLGN